MPALEVYDTVRVKNGSIIGTVDRTHLGNTSDTIEISDFLIIAHVEVPQRVIIDFATSGGIPPRGYVFVVAAEDAQGAFLAAEDDLELLSRSFDIGDSVKREDGLLGTVVDVSDTYNIRPVWLHQGNQVKHFSECEVDVSSLGIAHVPCSELRTAEEVFEGNFVSLNHWLGMVEEADIDVIIRLENDSVVAVTNPSDLFLPITDLDKPLVHLPDFDHISRPHALSAFGGWSSVIATDHPKIGHFVVTSRSTARSGRWLVGSYDREVPPQGRVLAVVPRTLIVDWLVCSPFVPLRARDIRRPSEEVNVYENTETYTRGDELRMAAGLKMFDRLLPTEPTPDTSGNSSQQATGLDCLHPDLRTGDCVRFRDPTAAAVKYQDRSGGRFERINIEMVGGWDANVFSITSKCIQKVKVLWYDGRVSELQSNDLSKYSLFEDDFRPTDIVLHRSGLKMSPSEITDDQSTARAFAAFNEMLYFERPHDIEARQVGVIQTVNARERVATVRWCEDPHLLLQDAGSYLSQSSSFGPMGNAVEEVSIYEIMKFPALHRDYRNLVLIPPQYMSRSTHDIIQQGESQRLWQSLLSMWSNGGGSGDANLIFHGARERIRARGILDTIVRDLPGLPDERSNIDWVGEIVALGLDGSITVRLPGASQCRDEVVDFDRVLAIIDLGNLPEDDDHDDESLDLDMEAASNASTLSESIEYEGGERLDNDTDDENWESAEEDVADLDGDVEMTDGSEDEVSTTTSSNNGTTPTNLPALQHIDHLPSGRPTFKRLATHLTETVPLSFAVLENPPPVDQHQPLNVEQPSSSNFLKRMRYEHKILSTSLPPSIYVRTYESNLSLLRCLIIGPTDTPYENAPFVIDLVLPGKYPSEPPVAHFHSWTSGLGRINPNLYEEGKICLSLLGTWPGKESKEQWSRDATILQLLVSLQGLVMVKQPFYNEAGFEEYKDDKGYENESAQYSEKAYVMARGFVKHALTQPPGGLEEILAWNYLAPGESESMFKEVLDRGRQLISTSVEARKLPERESQVILLDGAGHTGSEAFLRPLSRGAMVMLDRLLNELLECLSDTKKIFQDMNNTGTESVNANGPEAEEAG